MIEKKSSLKPLALRLGVAVFSVLLLVGCNRYDPIIKEMDGAYAINEKNDDVSRVVQKYFPPGMKMDDAFRLLKLFYDQGFEVRENRLGGARNWPDGELKPYRDEATKRNRLQMDPKGMMVNYTITKRYDSKYFVVTKEALIYLRTDSEQIVESKGAIFVSGI